MKKNTKFKRKFSGKRNFQNFKREVPSFSKRALLKSFLPQLSKNELRVVTLGGFEEVGRNMFAVEHNDSIFVFDAGFHFIEEENAPGTSNTLPNISYLVENKHKIKALIITHAHLDHVGGIPFIMEKIGNPPIYTREFSALFIKKKIKEFTNAPKLNIKVVKPKDIVKIGEVELEFFDVYHSIPDSMGIVLKTKKGNVVVTGDLKLKHKNGVVDIEESKKWERIGKMNNLFLVSDSTNCENPGWSMSEEVIRENVENYIKASKGRVLIANFSSQIERMIAFVDAAEKLGKKIVLDGRSIESNMNLVMESKYFIPKKGTIIPISDMGKYPAEKIVIVVTGGQGEKYGALNRIAKGDHRFIKLSSKDTIIFSSSVIVGNGTAVRNLMNRVMKHDPTVIHYKTSDVHSTGHGNTEELAYIIRTVSPKYFVPGYGFHSMLKNHKKIALREGMAEENIFVAENGSILETSEERARILDLKVPGFPIFVDGNKAVELQKIVMGDRKLLAENGFMHISVLINVRSKKLQKSPDIISRGFIYLKESPEIIFQVRLITEKIIERELSKNKTKKIVPHYYEDKIFREVKKFLLQKTNKEPLVTVNIVVV